MTQRRKQDESSVDAALTPEESDAGRRIADRLVSEIREVIRELPLELRGLSELSDRLKVDRNLIQRVLGAGKQKDPVGVEALLQVPGPRGLLQFLAALRGAGMGDHEFDGLAAATKLFAEYLQGVGSQAALGRRLAEKNRGEVGPGTTSASSTGDSGGKALSLAGQALSPADRAERMFHDASAMAGCAIDATVTIAIIRKLGNEPFETEDLFCNGHIGYVGSPQSVPLSFHTYFLQSNGIARSGMGDAEGNEPFGLTDNSVLRGFSSAPLPTIVAVPTQAGNGVLHIVDSADWHLGEPHDLVTLNRIRSTVIGEQGVPGYRLPEREISSQASYPTRYMVTDVYVDRALFKGMTAPEAACHIWDTDLETKFRKRWLSMLPVRVPLEVLPPRIDQVGTAVYPRMQELTQSVFDLAGVDRSKFVGYRLCVEHPIWRAWYRIHFDFLGE